jgi:hypothetical protein
MSPALVSHTAAVQVPETPAFSVPSQHAALLHKRTHSSSLLQGLVPSSPPTTGVTTAGVSDGPSVTVPAATVALASGSAASGSGKSPGRTGSTASPQSATASAAEKENVAEAATIVAPKPVPKVIKAVVYERLEVFVHPLPRAGAASPGTILNASPGTAAATAGGGPAVTTRDGKALAVGRAPGLGTSLYHGATPYAERTPIRQLRAEAGAAAWGKLARSNTAGGTATVSFSDVPNLE